MSNADFPEPTDQPPNDPGVIIAPGWRMQEQVFAAMLRRAMPIVKSEFLIDLYADAGYLGADDWMETFFYHVYPSGTTPLRDPRNNSAFIGADAAIWRFDFADQGNDRIKLTITRL